MHVDRSDATNGLGVNQVGTMPQLRQACTDARRASNIKANSERRRASVTQPRRTLCSAQYRTSGFWGNRSAKPNFQAKLRRQVGAIPQLGPAYACTDARQASKIHANGERCRASVTQQCQKLGRREIIPCNVHNICMVKRTVTWRCAVRQVKACCY